MPPQHTPWRDVAILRPGQEVVIVNLSEGGALLESVSRMTPGARAELQLTGTDRQMVRGRIDRCHVAALDPLRYRGAVIFDDPLAVPQPTAGAPPSTRLLVGKSPPTARGDARGVETRS